MSAHVKSALFLLAGLGLAGRVLIPAGFMPAPIADGWPVQLCPTVIGVSDLLHEGHGADHEAMGHEGMGHDGMAHGDETSGEESGQHNPCPLGAFFATAALAEAQEALIVAPELGFHAWIAESLALRSTPVSAFDPRGPPSRLSLDS